MTNGNGAGLAALSTASTGVAGPVAVTQPSIRILRPGDTSKPNPFTICIVANPAMETPIDSGVFAADPIMSDQARFDEAAAYILNSVFGLLPNQAEQFVSDPAVAGKIRVVSLFARGLSDIDANS